MAVVIRGLANQMTHIVAANSYCAINVQINGRRDGLHLADRQEAVAGLTGGARQQSGRAGLVALGRP
jgi:hypothetical protein